MREGSHPTVSGAAAGDEAEADQAERAATAAIGEWGWALPLLGVVLIVSPLIRVASGGALFFGAPSAFVYLLVVWIGLILLAARLARRAERAERRAAERAEEAPPRLER